MAVIYFVDLSIHPSLPIRHRCIPSSVREVGKLTRTSKLGGADAAKIVPDDTHCRFWVRAQSVTEALRIAQERAGR